MRSMRAASLDTGLLMVPAAALACALLAPLASCKSSGSASAAATTTPPALRTDPNAVHVVGTTFRDTQGRQLLFRGYNAKVTTLFDVTFDDGRVPEETFPDLSETETARIEQLGWNVLRIPLSWSGLEPQPQRYAQAWLQKLDAVLAMAHEHAFYIIIDLHQDAYSKEIGEDGEPLWAIVPPPTQLLQGPYSDSRRLTGQVLSAGYSFFDNEPATDGRLLQSAYITAAQQIAAHVVGDPAVLGYEDFNEPVVLNENDLVAFHEAFADGIHAIDADAPVLFEPVSTRNETDDAVRPDTPWSNGPGAYAVHIYTCWFSTCTPASWASEDPSLLSTSMSNADAERAAWGTPIFVTEFGCDQTTTQGPLWMSAELDLQDQYLASSTAWEFSGLGSWGFHDANAQEYPETTAIMARMFPRAVAGDLLQIERPRIGDMIVHYRPSAQTMGLEHEVSLSTAYVTNPSILCDGQPVQATMLTGRATFVCPVSDTNEHTFEVVGTATSYLAGAPVKGALRDSW